MFLVQVFWECVGGITPYWVTQNVKAYKHGSVGLLLLTNLRRGRSTKLYALQQASFDTDKRMKLSVVVLHIEN